MEIRSFIQLTGRLKEKEKEFLRVLLQLVEFQLKVGERAQKKSDAYILYRVICIVLMQQNMSDRCPTLLQRYDRVCTL